MTNEKVFSMSFAKVYPMLIAKRSGRDAPVTRCLRSPHG